MHTKLLNALNNGVISLQSQCFQSKKYRNICACNTEFIKNITWLKLVQYAHKIKQKTIISIVM